MTTPDNTDEREARLDAILGLYFVARSSTGPVDRADWVNRYPEFATELATFFDEQDRLDRLIAPLADLLPPPPASTLPADPPAPTGTLVRYFGDYEIHSMIGRGGAGFVYRATQLSLNRPVALKLVRQTDDESLRRFQNEAEAAARLDHPHIVPVHEVGNHQGTPYLSMKLIDGTDLSTRLDDPAPDARALARLIALAGRAVHHAHQRGVLHRDLKPSNILLDRSGHPYVADFGLAKRLEIDGGLTQTGSILGTPAYMAPEQARGSPGQAVTIATDVHGLGATLYALLAGRPPFGDESILATLDQVRTLAPPRIDPGRAIDPDLETICFKCLEKEPYDRYPSAEALADDLDRWLRGEPILARPAGPAELFTRWCRRNPAIASLLAATSLLAVVLLVVLTVSVRLFRDQRDEARANFQDARSAVDEYLTRVAEDPRLRASGLQPLRRDLLASALRYYESFLGRHRDDPSLAAECADAALRAGRLRQELGSSADARALYERALALYRELADRGTPSPAVAEGLASALVAVGVSRIATGETQSPPALYEEAIRVLSRFGRHTPGMRSALAGAHHEIGALLVHQGRRDEAVAAYRRAVAQWEALRADRPADPSPTMSLVGDLFHLGWVVEGDEALASLERAHRLILEVAGESPGDPGQATTLLNSYTNLANVHQKAGRLTIAEPFSRASLALTRRLASENPEVVRYRGNVSISLANLAGLLGELGQIDNARDLFDEAAAISESIVASAPQVSTYRAKATQQALDRGALELDARATEAATTWYRRALDHSRSLTASDPSARHDGLLVSSLVGLARAEAEANDLDPAGRHLADALPLLNAMPPDFGQEPIQAEHSLTLARVLRLRGDLTGARSAASRAVDSWRQVAGSAAAPSAVIGLARAEIELGEIARSAGDPAGASDCFLLAIDRLAAASRLSPDHRVLASWLDRARQVATGSR